ncbi:DUF1853 family protein [Polaribacter sp.]|uniref:DUF1853 family protein n=1 Tax=Polaribacter sp. TaxID=1920175 RepID=UPI003EF67683
MNTIQKKIQLRFKGFINTNPLWQNKAAFNMQLYDTQSNTININLQIDEKLRLGKYIERFVSYQLKQEKNISILCENIQIQKEKITLGELDCILLKDKKPIHLEIIYKFYVYDETIGNTEIDHFIGPNRKDSLVEKLTKLRDKQLPLLYSKECTEFLKTINLNPSKILQQVYFKAQLFVPLSKKKLQLSTLNSDCIVGFYINTNELEQFYNCKFFVPSKKDWLIQPHQHVNWLNFYQFKTTSKEYLERQFSPLCWVKHPNGEIEKFFLVWWGFKG